MQITPYLFSHEQWQPLRELSPDQRDVGRGNSEGQEFRRYFKILFLIRRSKASSAVHRRAQELQIEIKEGHQRETLPERSRRNTCHGRNPNRKRFHPCPAFCIQWGHHNCTYNQRKKDSFIYTCLVRRDCFGNECLCIQGRFLWAGGISFSLLGLKET